MDKKNRLVVSKMGKKLICSICNRELEVPTCCDKSMILKNGFLLCCCSEECSYQAIPECCGQEMDYLIK